MKNLLLFIAFSVLLTVSCNNAKEKKEVIINTENDIAQASPYEIKGNTFEDSGVVTSQEMLAAYQGLKKGDTIAIKVKATVNSVCQSKGCWMRLDLGEKESFVKFQDYGFFMPKDLAGTEVIVNGNAFVEETSVDDLKHFAEDAGKSKEEIEAITAPELSYNFLSTGVLIPKAE